MSKAGAMCRSIFQDTRTLAHTKMQDGNNARRYKPFLLFFGCFLRLLALSRRRKKENLIDAVQRYYTAS
jgi:hypothetical protein